ncbi:MAG: hypothetical protein IT184_01565 [Acidobacteria bacterium]|nr:hypothetical protein [Acidobacteriota bacterium]
MSILVRPVREQLEHDRLIRHLQARYKGKRKFNVAVNVGDEQLAPVKIGPQTLYPDLVLTDGRKLALIVEVESGESTNNLEALYQWVHFSRARVPFHLYIPVSFYEAAKRLCEANQARVSEIWTYRPASDGFDLVKVYNESPSAARQSAAPRRAPNGAVEKEKPAKAAPASKKRRPVAARPRPATRPAARAKAAVKGRTPAKAKAKPAAKRKR